MVNKEHALLWITALEDGIIEQAYGFLERKFKRDGKEVIEGCPLGVLTIVAMANGVEVATRPSPYRNGGVNFGQDPRPDGTLWLTSFPPSQVTDWLGTADLSWVWRMNDHDGASFAEVAVEARRRYL